MRSVPLPFLSKITLLWTRAREPGPVSPVKVDSPLPFPWTQRGEIYSKVVKQFLPGHDSLLIAIVDRSFSVFIHVCNLLPFCVNENRTQTILRAVFQWVVLTK